MDGDLSGPDSKLDRLTNLQIHYHFMALDLMQKLLNRMRSVRFDKK